VKIIGVDTATDDTVVAAMDGERVLFERLTGPGPDGRPRHSETLLTAAEEAAESLGGWQRVDRIAAGTGPGTFTGIRIGIATATGLSLSTGLPLVPVPTLAALAVGAGRALPGDGPVMPVLDARRGEAFAGLFNPVGRELEPAGVFSPERLTALLGRVSARLPRPPRIAGPGSLRFRDQLERAGYVVPETGSKAHRLSGRALCELGAGPPAARAGTPLEPIYLRAPDAQIWLERDRPGGGTK